MKSSLIREADRVFSLYVRNRGSEGGYNHCYICGVYLPIEELQAAHFRSRRFMATRWHPVNVWANCNRCNVELGGALKEYELKLRAQFGDDAIDGLYLLSRSPAKFIDHDIREIIKEYK